MTTSCILASNKKVILNLKSIILAHFIILLYWSILLILEFAVSVDLPLRWLSNQFIV